MLSKVICVKNKLTSSEDDKAVRRFTVWNCKFKICSMLDGANKNQTPIVSRGSFVQFFAKGML